MNHWRSITKPESICDSPPEARTMLRWQRGTHGRPSERTWKLRKLDAPLRALAMDRMASL